MLVAAPLSCPYVCDKCSTSRNKYHASTAAALQFNVYICCLVGLLNHTVVLVLMLQVTREVTPEDFDSQQLQLQITATAKPLGSTLTLQQTEILTLSLLQNPQISVELSLANTSTIEAAGMLT